MFRRLYRRYRWLLLGMTSCYLVTCVLLMTSLQSIDGRPKFQRWFERIFDPFESITNRQCSLREEKHKDVFSGVTTHALTFDVTKDAKCYASDVHEYPADIDVDQLWDTVSMGYPNLVLTVTGWVEPVQVLSWTPKPLHVIIMPHSHQDPGWIDTVDQYYCSRTRKTPDLLVQKLIFFYCWIDTVDQYYSSRTRKTLDLLVQKLVFFPYRKFVWTEVIFLERWWQKASHKTREQFKLLLDKGQLEILTGGWVMTDESVAHYGAMLDQLTEGQLWINRTFGKTAHNGWAIDPFGHSSTMSYLLAHSGIQFNVIQRAHFAIKKQLASTKSLEFYWKQHWDDSYHRVLTHLMPFLLYGISYTCGPDRTVCCKFDFYKKQCFYGNKKMDKIKVDENNVAQLSHELWEQLQKKSELFKNRVLLVPYGDDFRFDSDDEWDLQYGYLRKIMKYINGNPQLNMKIEFGTISDYVKAVGAQPDKARYRDYPTLTGDLYPYTDRGDQYWSGFYSVRPFYKYMARKLQGLLRSAEILFTFSLSGHTVVDGVVNIYNKLEQARRALALFQHHDAITGTSRKLVVIDYGKRLRDAINSTQLVYKDSVTRLLQTNTKDFDLGKVKDFVTGEKYPYFNKPPTLNVLKVRLDHPATVVVTNTLAFRRRELATVLVDKDSVVVRDDVNNVDLRHQISPVWIDKDRTHSGRFMLSFEVDIGPLSVHMYKVILAAHTKNNENVAKIFNLTPSSRTPRDTVHSQPFVSEHEGGSSLTFSNQYLTGHFSHCDGMLMSVQYHGDNTDHKADVHFVQYSTGERFHPFKDKSGAYTFIPDGPATELNETHPVIIVTQGPLFTEVKAIYRDIVHTSTIFNVTGPLGMGVHLENTVDINHAHWNNRELAMRVETDVRDDRHTFCTDVNGFQFHKRKTRAKMSIQGNFYPMTTMAILEDDQTRFSLLTASSHGVASLVSGWLEVVLDRRLAQDDWRGLNENVTDNIPTKSSFFIMFEKRASGASEQVPKYDHICLPSMMSDHLSERLNSPLMVVFLPTASLTWKYGHLQFIQGSLCDIHVLNMRTLPLSEGSKLKETLMVLHRKGYDCDFPHLEDSCAQPKKFSLYGLTDLVIDSLQERTLTGAHIVMKLEADDRIALPAMHMKTFMIGYI